MKHNISKLFFISFLGSSLTFCGENEEQAALYNIPDSPVPVKSVILSVHRTCVRKDLIEHFRDPSLLESDIDFEVISELGQKEKGVGIGVAREVYSLFWKEFATSMTIRERERVPFVRHDHFVEEWQPVGRILVKGFTGVGYFPLFLSKALIRFCLFENKVPDDTIMS